MDAERPHPGHRIAADERLGRRQPGKPDAFFLGVLHLAPRPGHVLPVAPVEAGHRSRVLADGGAHAIHRRVAAADDHDILARGVEPAVVEGGDRIAEALAVRGDQVFERGHDIAEPAAGHLDLARPVDAGRDQHRVVAFADLGEAGIAADFEAAVEDDAALFEQGDAASDDGLFELEIGDAVDQQPAHAVMPVVDLDLIAAPAQLLGRGEPGRPRADDADRAAELARRRRRLDPAALEGGVGDVTLHRTDGHRAVAGLLDNAVAFAQPVVRTDPAADLRHVVGRRGDLVGLRQTPLGGQHQPVRDVVVDRAVDLAIGHAALRAAARLGRRPLGREDVVDLVEIGAAGLGAALLRRRLGQIDEFQHLARHACPVLPRRRCFPYYPPSRRFGRKTPAHPPPAWRVGQTARGGKIPRHSEKSRRIGQCDCPKKIYNLSPIRRFAALRPRPTEI